MCNRLVYSDFTLREIWQSPISTEVWSVTYVYNDHSQLDILLLIPERNVHVVTKGTNMYLKTGIGFRFVRLFAAKSA